MHLSQVNISTKNVLLSALYNVTKETILRFNSFKSKIWLIIIIIFFFIKSILGFILICIFLSLIFLYYLNELYRYWIEFNYLRELFPKGYMLYFDHVGFSFKGCDFLDVTPDLKPWSEFNLAFDNKLIGNITIFNKVDGSFYKIYKTKTNMIEFQAFQKLLYLKIPKIV